ncbi:MAG: aryl-sulfate sulfotransferase, partial [Candidatus Acidiferrales bacterium]
MVPVSISPTAAAIAPGQSVRFTASGGNASQFVWSVSGIQGGNSNVGTVDSQGNYAAPAGQTSLMATVTVSTSTTPTSSSSASVAVIAPGQVTPTTNPQVAMYTISPPTDASVSIQFSADTNYGLKTWTQPVPAGGGLVSILVAGMRASIPYHMRAVVQLSNGLQFTDSDHVFTTGGLQPTQLPTLTATTTPGMSPQSGVEMLDLMFGNSVPVVVSDLAGNVIWTYSPSDGTSSDLMQPIKMLPNGHFLVVISPNSSDALGVSEPPGTITVAREIDLSGATVREISLTDLNTRLANANFNLVASDIHHDILPLPNGHWILLVNTIKQCTDLTGCPVGTTAVLGDALVDLDTNLNPVWVWSTFDHLDVSRHPMGFPDWTHSNALIYSPDDGDLLLSMRHQNWIIKIDYKDGAGTGNIVWH